MRLVGGFLRDEPKNHASDDVYQMLSIKSPSVNCFYQCAVSWVAEHFLYPSGGSSCYRRSNKGELDCHCRKWEPASR